MVSNGPYYYRKGVKRGASDEWESTAVKRRRADDSKFSGVFNLFRSVRSLPGRIFNYFAKTDTAPVVHMSDHHERSWRGTGHGVEPDAPSKLWSKFPSMYAMIGGDPSRLQKASHEGPLPMEEQQNPPPVTTPIEHAPTDGPQPLRPLGGANHMDNSILGRRPMDRHHLQPVSSQLLGSRKDFPQMHKLLGRKAQPEVVRGGRPDTDRYYSPQKTALTQPRLEMRETPAQADPGNAASNIYPRTTVDNRRNFQPRDDFPVFQAGKISRQLRAPSDKAEYTRLLREYSSCYASPKRQNRRDSVEIVEEEEDVEIIHDSRRFSETEVQTLEPAAPVRKETKESGTETERRREPAPLIDLERQPQPSARRRQPKPVDLSDIHSLSSRFASVDVGAVEHGREKYELRQKDYNRTIDRLATACESKEYERSVLNREQRRKTWLPVPLLEEIEVEPELPEFRELTDKENEMVEKAWSSSGYPEEVVVEEFKIPIKRRDLQTLKNLNWLNDEIINYYLNLIATDKTVYSFNTFFYGKIMEGGHAPVKRWTRKVDIFSFDILLIPVHLQVHWCMAVVDFKQRRIAYYDSMNGRNDPCLMAVKAYLEAEHLDKKKTPIDLSDFKLVNEQDVPSQNNGSDCGVFALKFGEYASRRATINFSQVNMPYFRKRIALEILQKELLGHS